ncbi:TipAS antibiotic-recognition domain-containing protein [Nonomuraea sp. CA-143628]|uniref:TipAS antibiotic-recognition domain-containing protein n=1 Tax=Nonomuraea sp. CA-143628 TaxID=3239997 RepID=UPI003D94B401
MRSQAPTTRFSNHGPPGSPDGRGFGFHRITARPRSAATRLRRCPLYLGKHREPKTLQQVLMCRKLGFALEEAMDVAERHRAHISRWCDARTHEVHRGLGELYVADPRFAARFEDVAPRLAVYFRVAIAANARR